jgi:hypothetical protein
MNPELKNILSQLNKDVDQEELLQYLNSSLTAAEQHKLETQLNEDAFLNDAAEGLAQLANTNELPAIVHQLNAGLKATLEQKKKKRSRKRIFKDNWTYLTILVILLLAVLAYVVIQQLMLK